mgnify:CR=1 FL=1|jgi:hypothetical protein
MTLLNKLQTAALTVGIAAMAGCAATGSYHTNTSSNTPSNVPEVGVTDTGSQLVSIACAEHRGDFALAKAAAETRAESAIMEYLGLEGTASMSVRFTEYSYFPNAAYPENICVEAVMDYQEDE